MKLGIHAYAWCSQWSNETLDLIDRVKSLDMDFIEIPLMCLETLDAAANKERLEKVGLGAVTSTVLLGDTDITSDDEAIRAKGVEYLKACVQATHDIGATNFSGVVYSQFVKPSIQRPTEQAWEYSADCLREAAKFAQDLNVNIGIEPVNRYETYLVNTCEQAIRLKNMIGEDNIKIHLDTYHMNIEEKSYYEATKMAGKDLIHYHLCENDRPGKCSPGEFRGCDRQHEYVGLASACSGWRYSSEGRCCVYSNDAEKVRFKIKTCNTSAKNTVDSFIKQKQSPC
ncbi:MAG: sugar phosphate isomerase/epimerase family protein [Planctomycetota bacterium]|jgi:D-psicose/D-tagatose/L-ribulose 3-epimerase